MSESRIIVYGLNTASQTYQPLEINTAGQTSVNITGFDGLPLVLQSVESPEFTNSAGNYGVGDNIPVIGVFPNLWVDADITQALGSGRTIAQPANGLNSFSGGNAIINTGDETVSTANAYNYGWRGLWAAIVPSSVTTSIQISLLGVLGGHTFTILQSAVLTDTTPVILKVYPGLVAVTNLVANDILPQVFSFSVTSVGSASTSIYMSLAL